MRDVAASVAWTQALAAIARRPAGWMRSDGAAVAALLLSPSLGPAMDDLYQESTQALDRHGLDDLIQVQSFVVDRLENEEEAVILLGPEQRAYLLPRYLLRVAGLEREKAWGILIATRTGTGIDLDVWPPVGVGTIDAAGLVPLRRADKPAFLDACLPQPLTCPPL